MKTILTKNVKQAARFIKHSDVVGFPTETVYGLGTNVFDEKAISKIFKVKGRPADNPLIVHISDKKQIDVLTLEVSDTARKIIKQFFPGPLTIIFKKNEIIPGDVTAGLDTIAIRMPSMKITREFIKECDVPIAAPSANLSGSPSPTSFVHVLNDFKGKIPCVLIGPNSRYGLESTVIDCSVEPPVILRPGVVTLEQLRKIEKRIRYLRRPKNVKSPGQKYRHYSPKAKVKLVNRQSSIVNKMTDSAYIGLTKPKVMLKNALVCKSIEDYAKNLFSFFRKCDELGIKKIYAEKVSEKGIGLAIMNRLKKASY